MDRAAKLIQEAKGLGDKEHECNSYCREPIHAHITYVDEEYVALNVVKECVEKVYILDGWRVLEVRPAELLKDNLRRRVPYLVVTEWIGV